jgi:hypothetical protein
LAPGTFSGGGVDQYFNPNDPNFDFNKLTGARQFQMTWPVVFRDIPDHLYTGYAQGRMEGDAPADVNLGLPPRLPDDGVDEWVTWSRYPRPLPLVDFKSRGGKPLGSRASASHGTCRVMVVSVRAAASGTAYQVFFNGNQGNELVALLQNNINSHQPDIPGTRSAAVIRSRSSPRRRRTSASWRTT